LPFSILSLSFVPIIANIYRHALSYPQLLDITGGGDSSKSKKGTIELIEKKGCKVTSYRDVRTGKGIVKEKSPK